MRLSSLIKRIEDAGIRTFSGKTGNEAKIRRLRKLGVKIGEGCVIHATVFSTEPYLVEIGDRVGIAGGTQFLTHDGAAWLLRDRYPHIRVFGRITVGSGTYIGQDCLILPGTAIGRNCLIGAGTLVKGTIPDESVVLGNPGRVVMKTEVVAKLLLGNEGRVDEDVLALSPEDRKAFILRRLGTRSEGEDPRA